MADHVPARVTARASAFLKTVRAASGRLIFVLDATASRQPTWDTACHLQAEMFQQAAGLQVQLVYYRGNECRVSRWTHNANELASTMRQIVCVSGQTQIGRALGNVRREHGAQPVNAVVFVGDAVEEVAGTLYDAAAGCPPVFVFQEGDDPGVMEIFRQIARRTGGAYERFDPGAANKLAELLRAVAAFATGGVKALADLNSEGARKLLGQIKKQEQIKGCGQ